MKFSYIDIFLIGGLALGGFLGYKGGLVKKLFNLLMLVVSVVLAIRFMRPIADFFAEAGVLSETAAGVVAFALIVLVIMVPAMLVYHRFGKSGAGKTAASVVGVILGVLEGAILISFVLLGMKVFDLPEKETRQESFLYRPMLNVVPRTFDFLQAYFPSGDRIKEEMSKRFKDIDLRDAVKTPTKP
jgi:membrane protein required for colicin V production